MTTKIIQLQLNGKTMKEIHVEPHMTDKIKLVADNKPVTDIEKLIREDREKAVAAFEMFAELQKIKFEAYKKAGFTPEQALKLVMERQE